MGNVIEVSEDQKALELSNKSEEYLQQYKDFKVVDNDQYLASASHISDLKKRKKDIEDYRKSMTSELDKLKKKWMDFFRPAIEKIDGVICLIQGKALTYHQEQEAIRIKEENRLREIQRKEEEKEKARLEKKAQKAEEKGDVERAEELRDKKEDVFVPPVHVQSTVSNLPGRQHIRKTWYAEVVNVNKIPREYMIPDVQALNAMARAKKIVGEVIPGVRFYSKDSISG